ncbi:MAG: hypothetical protein JST54_16940 [Deltaproteobacteria bacterium]|nr:hypothetical protein [Deltaproteobacteria bacterium]
MRFRFLALASLVAVAACVAAKHEEKANVISQPDGGRPLSFPRVKPGLKWPPPLASVRGRGLALFRCDVTMRGTAENCTVEKGVDGVDDETLLAFARSLSFEPAQRPDGTPIDFQDDRFSIDIRPARAAADGGAYHASGTDDDPVFFTPDMKKPKFDEVRSEPFHWTARQVDAQISGLVLVQCDLTRTGHLWNCMVLKRLEAVSDDQILKYADGVVYSPAEFPDGGAAAIARFTVPLRLKVP